MNHLQCQAGLDLFGVVTGPTTEQVPRAEPEMFGDQEPQADEGARDFVGKQLADVSFQAQGISGFLFEPLFCAMSADRGNRRMRVRGVEFFFEGRSRR